VLSLLLHCERAPATLIAVRECIPFRIDCCTAGAQNMDSILIQRGFVDFSKMLYVSDNVLRLALAFRAFHISSFTI
ncbi:hypothetical protein PFISCL1PPCAC_21783, partial [Pristionchus fissidentatus]